MSFVGRAYPNKTDSAVGGKTWNNCSEYENKAKNEGYAVFDIFFMTRSFSFRMIFVIFFAKIVPLLFYIVKLSHINRGGKQLSEKKRQREIFSVCFP